MMRFLLPALIALLGFSSTYAQRLDHRQGYVIVQVVPDFPIGDLLTRHSALAGGPVTLDRTLSNRMSIYLLHFDFTQLNEIQILQRLRQDPATLAAQYDHIPTLRAVPDDPMLSDQWQWVNLGQTGGLTDADIDADEAWNITTGGLTALGDTIVVAIIDDGLDFSHEDIAANVWRNHQEIDGNGIDDDGNGYVDDIYGWNAYDDNPDVFGQSHGLQVAGMVGAVGNNQTGIAGLNWNVKLMTIVGGTPESAAIASYAYALEQRILYNETNGARGAFVVATNSSWGIDFGQPSESPLWCAFYDSLGVHGILSAAATSNVGYDVDQQGDLPTGCTSDYLLSVTALNHSNSRTFSAWGLNHVDFGAPGESIFTTRRNNGYGTTSGTSFASPIAAGLVALLYAAPCENLAELARNEPAAAAAYVRDVIFEGVTPIDELAGLVKFGGGLNAGNSLELMMALCSDCPIPFSVEADVLSDQEVILTWSVLEEPDSLNARYSLEGSGEWDTLPDVTQPLLISGLTGCANYTIEFESICADTSTGFVASHVFMTDGCCVLPAQWMVEPAEEQLFITWDDILAAEFYLLQWRPVGETEWQEEAALMPGYTLENLTPCTLYELRLQTDCDTAQTGFTDIVTARTRGCGNCIDLAYCESLSADASEEMIDSLIIGPLVNHSGSNDGYALFESNAVFVAGDTYPVWLRPGFPTGVTFDEYFRIWIDFDQNGIFDEHEMLVDSILEREDAFLATTIAVPDSAISGSTRMRVSMNFSNPFFPVAPGACDLLEFGEVEDYCITIIQPPADCPAIDTVFFDAITFTGAFMYWSPAESAIAYTYRYREAGTTDYTEFATVDTTAILSDLEKCKTYEVEIMTVCPSDTAGYVIQYLLETECDVAVGDPPAWLAEVSVFPNPATDAVSVRFRALSSGRYDVALISLQGTLLSQGTVDLQAGEQGLWQETALSAYPPGLYLLAVTHQGQRTIQKFVKL